jgi:uncharacterized protein (TIGR03435 family)
MVWAQSRSSAQPKPAPKFDVASVKPCDPHAPRGTNAGSVYSGRVAYNCEPLTSYIRQAYAMYPDGKYDLRGLIVKIEGGASWVNTDRYQIDAKAEGAPGIGTVSGPMMQALLEDRFKLKVRRETREVPVYALVVAKSGLKVPAAKVGCFTLGSGPIPWKPGEVRPPICGGGRRMSDGVQMHGATIADFCLQVSTRLAIRLDRRVIDRTGVAGSFDFDLKWPTEDLSPAPAGAPQSVVPDDFDHLEGALRLVGLRLVPSRGSGEFLVIDHAERPTAN